MTVGGPTSGDPRVILMTFAFRFLDTSLDLIGFANVEMTVSRFICVILPSNLRK